MEEFYIVGLKSDSRGLGTVEESYPKDCKAIVPKTKYKRTIKMDAHAERLV